MQVHQEVRVQTQDTELINFFFFFFIRVFLYFLFIFIIIKEKKEKINIMSESQKWGCCLNVGNGTEENFMECEKCRLAFHCACMSITAEDFETASSWNCPNCLAQAPRSSKEDCTPLRNVSVNRGCKRQAMSSPSPPAASSDLSDTGDLRATIQDVIKAEFNNMLKRFNESIKLAINRELKPIREEIKDIKESMSFINDQFEEIRKQQEASNKTIKELKAENEIMKSSIGDLNARINYLEQQSRSCNLELQCVPENKQEDLYKIVMQLGKTVNCELKTADILHCTRTAKLNRSSTRHRSIIVQLASPMTRDKLLASAIKFNKTNSQDRLNSCHLGISGPKTQVYIVEHLSPSNKALHAATRIKAKEKGYKYVWIRSGRVFVRKNETAEYIIIKNTESLNKII